MAIVLSLSWSPLDKGMVLDSRLDEKYPDRGVTISYLAQQCSSAPRADSQRPSIDTGRTQYRALYGGKRGKQKDGTLKDDGLPTLTGLGAVKVHSRKGLPNHYEIDVGLFKRLSEKAQAKVVEHVKAREARNGTLEPGADGYEPPWAPELPDHASLLLDEHEPETGTNEHGDSIDAAGIPLWVPELDADCGSRAECWTAIRSIAMELWPDHNGRDAARRRGELVKPLLHLWRSPDWRGGLKRPTWARLTADVVRYIRVVRECHNVSIMTRWRGWQKGYNGKWSQANKDWTLPMNVMPSRLLKPAKIAEVLLIADVHDEQGPCGCQHERLPIDDGSTPAEDVTFETIMHTIDGPATAETDAAGLWQRTLVRLRKGLGRTADMWFEPAEARRIEEGRLVVALPNVYYADYIRENLDVAPHTECGLVFVTGPPKEA